MTLIVPTAYRRNAFRERNQKRIQAAPSDAAEVSLTCLRCFRLATVGTRCDQCRDLRKAKNAGRKR